MSTYIDTNRQGRSASGGFGVNRYVFTSHVIVEAPDFDAAVEAFEAAGDNVWWDHYELDDPDLYIGVDADIIDIT